MTDHNNNDDNNTNASDSLTDIVQGRRNLFATAALMTTSIVWYKPVINAVILPAHAQTSTCVTDTTVGGPLAGHPSGATTCQAACEAEAASLNAELCTVEEVATAGGTDCACGLDLP